MKDVNIMQLKDEGFLSCFEEDIVKKVQISHISGIMNNSRHNLCFYMFF